MIPTRRGPEAPCHGLGAPIGRRGSIPWDRPIARRVVRGRSDLSILKGSNLSSTTREIQAKCVLDLSTQNGTSMLNDSSSSSSSSCLISGKPKSNAMGTWLRAGTNTRMPTPADTR